MEVGVEQTLQDIFSDFVNVDRRIIPSLNHQIDRVNEDDLGQMPSRLVQYQVEMILAKEGMRGIASQRVIEYLVLVMGIDNLRGGELESIGRSLKDRLHERLHGREHEHGYGVANLLYEST